MTSSFAGQGVVVTGAAQGIGAAIAEYFVASRATPVSASMPALAPAAPIPAPAHNPLNPVTS